MRTRLLVHFCPYCGAQTVHELEFITDGYEIEHSVAFCLTCDETFAVERELDLKELDELIRGKK